MSASIDDLMKSEDVGLPEATEKVCLAGKLVAQLAIEDQKLFDLEAEVEAAEQKSRESEGAGKRRMAVKPEVVKLREQAEAQAAVCDEIRARMESHTVDITVRGTNSGAWQAFRDAHPPRTKDDNPSGYNRDLRYGQLVCNFDDLVKSAGDYIVKYGDQEPTEKRWEFLSENAIPSDMDKLGKAIVLLHEGGVNLGKSRTDSLASLRAERASK